MRRPGYLAGGEHSSRPVGRPPGDKPPSWATAVEGLAWEGAKILVFILLFLAVLSFLGGSFRRRSID